MHKTVAFVAMFLGSHGLAHSADRPNPINVLGACSANIMLNMQISAWMKESAYPGHMDALTQAMDAKRTLSQCAEKALPSAIDAAGDHADLKSAVKEYYIKQSSFFSAIGTSSERYARDEEMEAFKRVGMEMKLAGIQ